jgi:hypothetical protein
MPEVIFEPTITASERVKTVHALDLSATVTGGKKLRLIIYLIFYLPLKLYENWAHIASMISEMNFCLETRILCWSVVFVF